MKFPNIFDKNEKNDREAFRLMLDITNPKNKVISAVTRIINYNDEPKLFHIGYKFRVSSKISDTENYEDYTGGISFNKRKAYMKALGEVIERYCLAIYKEKDFKGFSYKKINNLAVNPKDFSSFTKEQLNTKEFKDFRFDEKTKFKWLKGFSIFERKEKCLPAQLIYVPYIFSNEPVIRLPISTGAAAGTSLSGALYRGLCEIVERDSFMIYFLNRISPARIDFSDCKNKEINKILNYIKRYELEILIFDITTDVKIPTVLSIITDKTEIGPAISLGLKTDLNIRKAIIGSIEESLQSRSWIRDEMYNKKKTKDKFKDIIIERGLYWSKKERIKKLDFLLKTRKSKNYNKYKINTIQDARKKLGVVLEELKKANVNIFFSDITVPFIKKNGFFVVKVLADKMQPLYLDEKYKYLGGERLISIPRLLGYKAPKKLNNDIHPFL